MRILLALLVSVLALHSASSAEPVSISGIYPHLAMFNDEGECGTGAVVPWADRLWVITYGAAPAARLDRQALRDHAATCSRSSGRRASAARRRTA